MTESSFADKAYPLPAPLSSFLTLEIDSSDTEASITLDNQEIGLIRQPVGLILAVFESVTDHPLYCTCLDVTQDSDILVELLLKLKDNQLIALIIKSNTPISLSDRTKNTLNHWESSLTSLDPFQGTYGIIGRKGSSHLTESLSSTAQMSCAITLNYQSNPAEIAYPVLMLRASDSNGDHPTPKITLDDCPILFEEKENEPFKVVVFDELTGIPLENESFNPWNPHEERRFRELVDTLPHGRGIACCLTIAEATLFSRAEALSSPLQRVIQSLGSRFVEKYQKGQTWFMVGYKGVSSGSALEILQISTHFPLMLKVWLSPTLSPSVYWQPPQKLYAPNYHSDDAFGGTLAMDGNTALMASPLADTALERNVGAVYVFHFNQGQWQYQQMLQPHDLEYQPVFGKSMAIEGEKILIGAYFADSYWKIATGAIYSFIKKEKMWQQSQKLQPHDLHPEDCFGCAVAINQDTAFVGAYNSLNLFRQATGAVYVFKHINGTWQDQQKLQPTHLEKGDNFGHSVAINGNFAAVGAYLAQTTGIVYLFQQENGIWQESQVIQPTDLQAGDCFGYSVALEGDMLLIGAKNAKKGAKIGAGSVYFYQYRHEQWQRIQRWQPSDLRGYEHFGHSVVLDGDLAMVGADQGSSVTEAYTGAVYTFQRQGNIWQPHLKLYGINAKAGDRFGYAIALKRDLILVGSPSAEVFGRKGAGIVYPGHF